MWKKLIGSVALLSFVGLQLANSLRCYSSNSLTEEECNNVTANATTTWLNKYNSDVPQVAGNNRFGCMNMSYFKTNMTDNVLLNRIDHLGCYHEQIPVCQLTANVTPGSFRIVILHKYCMSCSTDLCRRNPAGTTSRSTYTIFATVIAAILARVLCK